MCHSADWAFYCTIVHKMSKNLKNGHFLQSTTKSSLFTSKTVFAQSSVHENKVLSREFSKLSKLTSAEVPCFHKMKNTVLKIHRF